MRITTSRQTSGKNRRGATAVEFAIVAPIFFMFVLGCNLMGMVPWVGAPTGSFGVTLALAAVTMGAGMVVGTKKFGVVGFWLNLLSIVLVSVVAVWLAPLVLG